MTVETLSADSQAIALLCSNAALPSRTELKPLTPREWDQLRAQIHQSRLARPGELLGKSSSELTAELEIPADLGRRVEQLLARGGQLAMEMERLGGKGIWMITRADDAYPTQLRRRLGTRAPAVLFGAGDRHLLAQRAIAIVGSREVTDDGLEFAATAARRAVANGLAVVSGAARGVDSAAMAAAIDARGSAVGVLADSLERLAAKRDFREPIAAGNLTLVTSYHPAARFNVGNAMRRNRLIYCLSQTAVVVASTVEKGGTRAGALENLEARWVPLLVWDDGSTGNTDLIRRGARGLTSGDLQGHSGFLNPAPPSPVALELDDRDALPDEPPSTTVADAGANVEPEVPATPAERPAAPVLEAPREIVDGDLFPVVWPSLDRFLQQQRSENEVAEHLKLETTQARAWLRRAQAEGLVERIERKRRYIRSAARTQDSLFDKKV
jgi:predicted Rossmann fold nucleotide-binding protein DprA/Smf involved in DNA uptake